MNRTFLTWRLSMLPVALVVLSFLAAATGANATLSAPQRVEITSTTNTLDLHWDTVNDPAASGYFISYGLNGPDGPYNGVGATEGASPIQVAGAGSNSLVLHGLREDTRYYFVIAAYDQENVSGAASRNRSGMNSAGRS